jgi:hypothetical protein
MKLGRACAAIMAIWTFCASEALADAIYSPSYSLTNNKAADVATGMRQVKMTLSPSPYGSGFVDFTFTNRAPSGYSFSPSSITDIYFDDGAFGDGIFATVSNSDPYNPQILSSAGVSFSRGATPETASGSGQLQPIFDVAFSTDSNAPVVPNGVDQQSEWLTIRWQLREGLTYQDAVSAVTNGEVRIGLKMQGFTGGGSENFIFVPLPQSVAGGVLLLCAFGAAGLARRGRGSTGLCHI